MIRIIFYLKKDKVNTKNECSIYCRVELNKKKFTLSTNKYISQKRWNETNKLKKTLKLATEKHLKNFLDSFKTNIESKYIELKKLNNTVVIEDLKIALKGKNNNSNNFIHLFRVHNSNFKKLVENGEKSEATLQKYERAKSLFQAFLMKKFNIKDISIDKINGDFIYKLEQYLRYESTFKNVVGISNNATVKYFKNFATVCNYAIKRNMIDKNPFRIYDGKLEKRDTVFLTSLELKRIERKTFMSERLNRVKDIFLFCCYTGYAPVDAHKLTYNDYIEDVDGDYWIITNRQKTNIKSNVPVLPVAQKIIEKYNTENDNYLIPNLSNQKMNEYLKEIGSICNINKKLTHYVARHTFATTVALGNGIAIEIVSNMMGHTRISTTQHYAKILPENVKNSMKNIAHQLK